MIHYSIAYTTGYTLKGGQNPRLPNQGTPRFSAQVFKLGRETVLYQRLGHQSWSRCSKLSGTISCTGACDVSGGQGADRSFATSHPFLKTICSPRDPPRRDSEGMNGTAEVPADKFSIFNKSRRKPDSIVPTNNRRDSKTSCLFEIRVLRFRFDWSNSF